jgi:hypothetical protein
MDFGATPMFDKTCEAVVSLNGKESGAGTEAVGAGSVLATGQFV